MMSEAEYLFICLEAIFSFSVNFVTFAHFSIEPSVLLKSAGLRCLLDSMLGMEDVFEVLGVMVPSLKSARS